MSLEIERTTGDQSSTGTFIKWNCTLLSECPSEIRLIRYRINYFFGHNAQLRVVWTFDS